MIAIENLEFIYDKETVLSEANLFLSHPGLIGVMGPNGGGKTTLLKLIMGFLSPDRGTIRVLNESPEKKRLHIGYVPQAHLVDKAFPITVGELVLLGALSKQTKWGGYPKALKEKALYWIDLLGLTPFLHAPFHSLSGGSIQKALFARALLSDPEILLLDEPTANIDPKTASLLLSLLEEMKKEKLILLVTHDLKTIVEKVDQVLCVQRTITSYLPHQVCEHFAMGLYHTPLVFQERREEHALSR